MLEKYQPKLIKTEVENEKALAVVEELMHRSNRSLEENELYELLIVLIEKFEQEYYLHSNNSTHNSMLLFLMEQQDVKARDLINILGSLEIVNKIIEGYTEITRASSQRTRKVFSR